MAEMAVILRGLFASSDEVDFSDGDSVQLIIILGSSCKHGKGASPWSNW